MSRLFIFVRVKESIFEKVFKLFEEENKANELNTSMKHMFMVL